MALGDIFNLTFPAAAAVAAANIWLKDSEPHHYYRSG
jgi:hypothetical protein